MKPKPRKTQNKRRPQATRQQALRDLLTWLIDLALPAKQDRRPSWAKGPQLIMWLALLLLAGGLVFQMLRPVLNHAVEAALVTTWQWHGH